MKSMYKLVFLRYFPVSILIMVLTPIIVASFFSNLLDSDISAILGALILTLELDSIKEKLLDYFMEQRKDKVNEG